MLTATTLSEQLEAQRDDRLRILIAGAGVAGVTLASLLRTQGLHPVLIERMPRMAHPGYMLALMPTVDAALRDLGVHDEYLARSAPLARYGFRSHRGKTLRTDDLGALLSLHGDYQGIERGALLEVLTSHGCPVTFDTTITAIGDDVAFSSGERASFDLVVAADGIHSRTRDLLDVGDVSPLDTGWAGWVTWSEPLGDPALGEELWGDGTFVGVYPAGDRLGIFVGGPTHDLGVGPKAFAERIREAAPELGPRLDAALDAVTADPDPYLWPLTDVRAERWMDASRQAVLLGDAASGFLPTAGIGAGMAMESAWMLGRMLAHADRANLGAMLTEWERVQKPRVESAQSNSRMLAKLMFRRGAVTAWLRETAMRAMTVKAVLGPIIRLIAEQPDPDAVARGVAIGGHRG